LTEPAPAVTFYAMENSLPFCFLSCLILSLTDPAAASDEIYRYIDHHGVVSYTDNLEKVPEAQRPDVQIIPVAPSPPAKAPTTAESRGADKWEWLGRPFVKPLLFFAALSLLMLLVQGRTQNLWLHLAIKLLFIGLLGAVVYITLLQPGSLSQDSVSKKVGRQADAIQKRLTAHEGTLDSIDPSSESSEDTDH